MRTFHLVAMLGLVSIATACSASAIGPGAQGTHPPPARPGMAVQEWEHYCVYPKRDFDEVLEEAGKTGFEMVGVTATDNFILVCFKRPVIFEAAPTTAPSTVPAS
jgi:hypothetical protein